MFECTPFLTRIAAALPLVVLTYPVTGQDEIVFPDAVAEAPIATDMAPEDQARWPYLAAIDVPPVDGSAVPVKSPDLVDLFASPDVFEHARPDLTDLRVYASDGSTVPYAMRVLSPKSVRDVIPATEFNRSEPEEGVHEQTLELQGDDIEHNEVVVETTGTNFLQRRRKEVIVNDEVPILEARVVRFVIAKGDVRDRHVVKTVGEPGFLERLMPDVRVRVEILGESGCERINFDTRDQRNASASRLASGR